MKNTRSTALLVCGLVVVVALAWFFLRSDSNVESGTRASAAASLGAPKVESELQLRGQSSKEEAAATEAPPAAVDVSSKLEHTERRRVVPGSQRRWTRRVIARVEAAGGVPLVQATLRLVAIPADGSDPDLASAFAAESDEHGDVEVFDVPSGRYCAVVGAAGFATEEHYGRPVGAGESFDLGTFTLDLGTELRGRVTDSAGMGVADAQLTGVVHGPWLPVADSDVLAVTDEAGHFTINTLPAGPWNVRVESQLFPSAEFSGTTRRAGEVVRDLELALPTAAQIHGRVTARPKVDRVPLIAEAEYVDEHGRLAAHWRTAVVGENGRFTLLGLDPDVGYRVGVRTRDGARQRTVVTHVVRPSAVEILFEWVPASTLTASISLGGRTGTATGVFIDLHYGCEQLMGFEDGPQTFPDGRLHLSDLHGYG